MSILSDGPLNDGIQLLKDTPLNCIPGILLRLGREKEISSRRTDLVIPMAVNSSEVKVDTEIKSPITFLSIKDLDLDFSDLNVGFLISIMNLVFMQKI